MKFEQTKTERWETLLYFCCFILSSVLCFPFNLLWFCGPSCWSDELKWKHERHRGKLLSSWQFYGFQWDLAWVRCGLFPLSAMTHIHVGVCLSLSCLYSPIFMSVFSFFFLKSLEMLSVCWSQHMLRLQACVLQRRRTCTPCWEPTPQTQSSSSDADISNLLCR